MKKTLTIAAMLLALAVAGGELFKPSPETIAKIKADPDYALLMRRADNYLKTARAIDPRGTYGTGRGRDIGFWPRVVGIPLSDWMEKLGFAYMITGDRKYADKGIELLVQTARDFPVSHPNIQRGMPGARGHITYGMAMGCIFFGDLMSKADLDLLADVLGGYIDDYLKHFNNPKSGLYHTANHTALNGAPAGMAALYFRDRPGFAERLEKVLSTQIGWLNHAFDPKGMYIEGYGYARYGMTPRLLIFGWLLREAGGPDIFKNPRLAKLPEALVAKLIPGTYLFDTRNDNDYTTAGLECLFLAVANQDPVAMWLWEHSEREMRTFPLNVLIAAHGTPPAKLEFDRLPKSEFFPGREFALWRTGWSDRDVMFSIESGPAVRNPSGVPAGHGQSDRGSFALYAFGDMWLPDSGYGNDPAHPQSRCNSFAHNLVLANGKGQAPRLVDGRMIRFSDSEAYGYSRSDITRAYKFNERKKRGAGARRVVRQTIFARPSGNIPAYAVVLDDFLRYGREDEFTWNVVVPNNKYITTRPGGAVLTKCEAPDRYLFSPANRPDGRAEWTIDVPADGDYALWALIRAGGAFKPASNSVWVTINDGKPICLDTNEEWWFMLSRPKEANALAPSEPVPVPVRLRAGRNRIVVSTREKEAEFYGLYLSNDNSTPFSPVRNGFLLKPADATVSGGMELRSCPAPTSADDRLEIFLSSAASEVPEFETAVYFPPNPRPPLSMQRLFSTVRAVNPYFAAVLVPLHANQAAPAVQTRRDADRVTVTVTWPDAVDTVEWPINADGSTGDATFSRQARMAR